MQTAQVCETKKRVLNFQAKKLKRVLAALAETVDDYWLLNELCVSHLTRQLIKDAKLKPGNIRAQVEAIRKESTNPALIQRIDWAFKRFNG